MAAPEAARLRFLGAAGTVTGSKHLLEASGRRVLLDCGLFQGLKDLRLRNWAPLPTPAAEIDAVVLSHAHIDHSGYLPRLVRDGFRGPIFCTRGTADLLRILLPDSAHLQEEDAERANRRGYSKHHPALPLYTRADADAALELLESVGYGERFQVAGCFDVVFRRAGHILGAATVELRAEAGAPWTLVFSGDLGRTGRPILRDPERVARADVLLVESTYGDRLHAPDPLGQLARIVNECAQRSGALLIPAFAVGRTQELIWSLRRLEDESRIPKLPVFIDSPMAIDVTELYQRHAEDHDLEMRRAVEGDPHPLRCHRHHLARTPEESKALNQFRGPLIVVSASGMLTGGRVLHHLAQRLPEARTTVLLTGFQAAGTRGRALQEGAASLRIHGRDVPVRARVETLDGLSAHADQGEILRWLEGFEAAPRNTYVVHGEPEAARALALRIERQLGWKVAVARDGEAIGLA